ncbi:Rpn family recombination-promoting nuclease/putative transposase [Nocardioides sp. AE5]|nr:Rpn family recombination-promoting nuclease/putative transposase [Nocardioides sp. AE5]
MAAHGRKRPRAAAARRASQQRDGLFRAVFSQPVHAASELRSVLPARVLERLDLDGLEVVPGSFVSEALRQQHTDALFATRWAGRDAYLFVLLEHQSTPDPWMAWRMLGYQVRIWERHLKENPEASRLPVIVPVVIYQGERPWKASTEFADLLDLDPDERAELDLENGTGTAGVPRFVYLLDDLSGADTEVILRSRPLTEEAMLALGLLGAPAGFDDPDPVLGPWRDLLARVRGRPGGERLLVTIAIYTWNISTVSGERMEEFMTTLEPEVADTFVSTWDRGMAEARTEGEARGHAALFATQAAYRFGDLDPAVMAAIDTATTEQITAWSMKLVEGTLTLDDLVP